MIHCGFPQSHAFNHWVHHIVSVWDKLSFSINLYKINVILLDHEYLNLSSTNQHEICCMYRMHLDVCTAEVSLPIIISQWLKISNILYWPQTTPTFAQYCEHTQKIFLNYNFKLLIFLVWKYNVKLRKILMDLRHIGNTPKQKNLTGAF